MLQGSESARKEWNVRSDASRVCSRAAGSLQFPEVWLRRFGRQHQPDDNACRNFSTEDPEGEYRSTDTLATGLGGFEGRGGYMLHWQEWVTGCRRTVQIFSFYLRVLSMNLVRSASKK